MGWPGSVSVRAGLTPASQWSSPRWPSSRPTGRRVWPSWSAPPRSCRRPESWCSPTPNAATSAPPWRPTPGVGRRRPMAADAVTASPYLGFGSLESAARRRRDPRSRRVRPGGHLQPGGRDGATGTGRRPDRGAVHRRRGSRGEPRLSPRSGSVGVVVGATLGAAVPDVSGLGGPVLVPGVGAQGGRPEDLAGLGGAKPGQLLPAVSGRCCGPARSRPQCARRPRRSVTRSPIWPDRAIRDTRDTPWARNPAGFDSVGCLAAPAPRPGSLTSVHEKHPARAPSGRGGRFGRGGRNRPVPVPKSPFGRRFDVVVLRVSARKQGRVRFRRRAWVRSSSLADVPGPGKTKKLMRRRNPWPFPS